MESSRADDVRWDRPRIRAAFTRLAALRRRPADEPGTSDSAESEIAALRGELVLAHLNLVRFLAGKFANRGEALEDLIQVGTVGLLKAIDRFDLERGVEFTTYATPTIVGEVKRYFRDKGWALKVPRRLQELSLAVSRAIEQLTASAGRAPTVAEIASRLGVSEEAVIEAQELGNAYTVLSLDTELANGGEPRAQTLGDVLGRPDEELAFFEDRENLRQALGTLERRERVIVHLRYYERISQSEIAKRLNVSQMHVSRLQQKALAKLRKVLAQ